MTTVLLGIGLVLAIEGLLLALMPARLEEFLQLFARIGVEERRQIGIIAAALGVLLVVLSGQVI